MNGGSLSLTRKGRRDTHVTVLYADGIISQCLDLAMLTEYLSELLHPTFYLRKGDIPLFQGVASEHKITWLGDALRVDTGGAGYSDSDLVSGLFTQIRDIVRELVADLDAFAIEERGGHVRITRSIRTTYDKADYDEFPSIVSRLLVRVKQLASSIAARLDPLLELSAGDLVESVPPLVLSGDNVMVYRQVAFRLLHPTVEDQRRLLVRQLKELSSDSYDERGMIENYGIITPRCLMCGAVTDSVSLASLLPRCSDQICRQLHV